MAGLVPASSLEVRALLVDDPVEPGHDDDIADHSSIPRWSATAKMSLSPRPHMFITIRCSRGKLGAILATWASACAGSSAGMMPSIRLDSWNASSASESVIETYRM